MPFPYKLRGSGSGGVRMEVVDSVRDYVECDTCQYKGMGAMGTPVPTIVPGIQLLTVPVALQYPLPSTGQENPMQICAIPFLAPSPFEKGLNCCDYFKLLFLRKQWEMAEEAILLEQSCTTYAFCN